MTREGHKRKLTRAFEENQRIIYRAAWQVWGIYGGDIDDYFGQAQIIFMKAFDDYETDRGAKLSTWIFLKVRGGLIDAVRHERAARRSPASRIDNAQLDLYPSIHKRFSIFEFVDELNEDARCVLNLFLDTPRDVFVQLRNSCTRVDHVQAHLRNRLRNRLRQMGWESKRINAAFDELSRASQ